MRNKKLQTEAEELNLAPIMNLMVTLIPMLLLSVSFIKLVILNTTLPAYASSGTTNQSSKIELNLTVAITDAGFTVGGAGGIIGNGNNTIAKLEDGSYDLKTLSELLKKIKDAHPEEWNITIVPEITTKYGTIIKVMDTAREYTAVSKDGKLVSHLLFPNIAIGGGII